MEIIKKTGTHNTSSYKNRPIKYIVIHYTAGTTSRKGSALNTAGWFLNPQSGGSADYIVDDETVVQYNPDIENRYCWHCGGNRYTTKGGQLYGVVYNSNSIGIEVCSSSKTGKVLPANDAGWYFTDKVLDRAVELTKYLMEKYNIDADHVVRHWDVNGKQCVPTYSEVLTKTGWKRIDEIEIGEEIACADLDKLNITFEEVYDLVPVHTEDTYSTSNGLTATKKHRMVYSYDQTSNFYRIATFGDLLAKTNIHIPMAGTNRFEGLPLTDDMLKFYVAVQADGHYMYERSTKDAERKSYYGLEFHLKKERKILRIKELLEAIHLDYSENFKFDGSVSIRVYNYDDVRIVEDICEQYLKDKKFTWQWILLSAHQAAIFLKEIQLWDGCVAGDLYTSSDTINLDVVNAIAALNGVGSNICGNNVMFRENPYITIGSTYPGFLKRNQGKSRHTEVTCVSVKTGIFLMRQSGKTFIVGNCPGIPGWNADNSDESAWNAFLNRIGSKGEELDMTKEELMSVAGTGDNPSSWAKEATEWAKENGIMNGDGTGNYGWSAPISREALVTVLHNFVERYGL